MNFDAIGAYVEVAPNEFLSHMRAVARDDVAPPDVLLGPVLAEQVAAADARAALSAAANDAPPNGGEDGRLNPISGREDAVIRGRQRLKGGAGLLRAVRLPRPLATVEPLGDDGP
ncbi:hypothetical protein [Streptomyces sp. S1D4-20]|uniref:hypothetical protein n=1 Tax=Streptomyces sp. S1D4-20 TaxID=2594462 RepID=UPI0011642B2D|nr:hypothetical protein [Streptomyces sp. S1D4-20]QDN54146.1 hypothetical protein FNV67_00795 [Streptomyces sp. S1D4-20]